MPHRQRPPRRPSHFERGLGDSAQIQLRNARIRICIEDIRVLPTQCLLHPVRSIHVHRAVLQIVERADIVQARRVVGAIWAAANGKKDPSTLLGFEVKDGIIAEYIDTEQPRDTHHTTWERAMRRAGYSRGEEPEHVRGRYHSLSRLTDPLELAAYVARMIYEGDADLYIVDGITDLMDDTNDNKESIQIVKLFEEAAAANGVTIVTTIHPNDKANAGTLRGHIGSHLLRKATTALRIDTRPKDEETYHRLWIPPNFKTRFSREPEVWFRWDDVQMMHVTTTAPAEEGRSKTKVMSRDDLTAIYSEAGASSFGTNDLTRRIAQKLDVSESTAKKRLTEAKEAGWLADMLGNGTALSLKYD